MNEWRREGAFCTSHIPQRQRHGNPASELLSNLRSLLNSLVTARNPLSISKPFIMNTIMKFTEYGNR